MKITTKREQTDIEFNKYQVSKIYFNGSKWVVVNFDDTKIFSCDWIDAVQIAKDYFKFKKY